VSGYRDDEEALRARVDSLEEKLQEREGEHVENEGLRRRIAQLEAERPKPPLAPAVLPPRSPSGKEKVPPIARPPPEELSPRGAGCLSVLLLVASVLTVAVAVGTAAGAARRVKAAPASGRWEHAAFRSADGS
jgi:hypothetical protein